MTHVQTSCLSPKQFTHFFIFNYYYHKILRCYSKEHFQSISKLWAIYTGLLWSTAVYSGLPWYHRTIETYICYGGLWQSAIGVIAYEPMNSIADYSGLQQTIADYYFSFV